MRHIRNKKTKKGEILPDNPQKLDALRLAAPSVQRNQEVILSVLEPILPSAARVLEIASGTGEHAIYFASKLKSIVWQPSDPEEERCRSIQAWIKHVNVPNVQSPLRFHTCRDPWPIGPFDAIVCINMLHISPWLSCRSLMQEGVKVLKKKGILYLYGPFKLNGKHSAPSNASFDTWLRKHNPQWGVRDLEEVQREAERVGFKLRKKIAMPAENFSLVFEKESSEK